MIQTKYVITYDDEYLIEYFKEITTSKYIEDIPKVKMFDTYEKAIDYMYHIVEHNGLIKTGIMNYGHKMKVVPICIYKWRGCEDYYRVK